MIVRYWKHISKLPECYIGKIGIISLSSSRRTGELPTYGRISKITVLEAETFWPVQIDWEPLPKWQSTCWGVAWWIQLKLLRVGAIERVAPIWEYWSARAKV